ncbi:N-acyl amino acid synthase FeeM domain-containing protein [Bacillus solitudinis]|uniref:N-acyl amino acid synthase FeeM domain-containing protein n=1 Tax=Bacillus solitudinis TaxID=2014074 RepID=UPI000C233E96|nr:hypothetical protein [Bacillus solitudinis]
MQKVEQYFYSKAEGEVRNEAITLHYKRYEEVGFFKNNEVDPYVQDSTYFIAETPELDKVVGVTRLIMTEVDKLPTIANFSIFDIEMSKILKLDKNQIAEVSAFTKMPQHDVGLGMIRTIIHYSQDSNVKYWICCIDQRVYNYFKRMFKFPFRVIGEPKVYLGSTSVPCLLDINESLLTLKDKRYPLYEYLITPQTSIMAGVVES